MMNKADCLNDWLHDCVYFTFLYEYLPLFCICFKQVDIWMEYLWRQVGRQAGRQAGMVLGGRVLLVIIRARSLTWTAASWSCIWTAFWPTSPRFGERGKRTALQSTQFGFAFCRPPPRPRPRMWGAAKQSSLGWMRNKRRKAELMLTRRVVFVEIKKQGPPQQRLSWVVLSWIELN